MAEGQSCRAGQRSGMTQQSNTAAKELWSQIFARAAEHPAAALMDPEYDRGEDEARARAAFAAAGWSDDQVEAHLNAIAERNAHGPVTSPGVNPSAEIFHAALCGEIEEEMARQGLTSQQQVARGIEPRTHPFASKTGVIMTEESIITVGAFTYRFCGLIAKAFHRTVMLAPYFWQEDDYSQAKACLLLRTNMPLALYWNQIFMSFAFSGTNMTVPFKPATPRELHLVEQVARAMELFIVGHEYGHHHFGHGRDVEADPYAEEYAADQFALRMCRPIGERDRRPIWNPYLASGAGGVIMLKALEVLRGYEQALGGKMPRGDTHPAVDERIERFDSVAVIEPEKFAVLKGFRTTSLRVMAAVTSLMHDFISNFPEEELKKLIKVRSRLQEELPNS